MSAAAADSNEHGLTPLQQRFADLYAQNLIEGTDIPQHELAQAAGYSGSYDTLRVAASRALAYPKVRDYLHAKARAFLKDQALPAAITLARLTRKASSERVQADVASRLAVGLGLIEGERAAGGPGIVLNLVLPGELGTLLAQAATQAPQAPVIEHDPGPTHSLPEGADGATPHAEGGGRGVKRAATKRGAGAKTRASVPPTAPPHDFPPSTSRGRKAAGKSKNSPARKGLGS